MKSIRVLETAVSLQMRLISSRDGGREGCQCVTVSAIW